MFPPPSTLLPKDEHNMITFDNLKKIRGTIVKHSGHAPINLKPDTDRVYMTAEDAALNLLFLQRKAREHAQPKPTTCAASDSTASNVEG